MKTSQTRLTGIFGYPIKHTLSPLMHNTAFKYLNLDFFYLPFEIKPEELKEAIHAIRVLNIAGVNLTIPHKENALKFLDKIDFLAKKIGSVNTLVNKNGILTGYNTDGLGFLKDLINHEINPRNKTAILVGAGGAGRAIASVLSHAGAKIIYITDKDEARAKKLVRSVKNSRFEPFIKWQKRIKETSLLVNATPLGMHDNDPSPVNIENLNKKTFVYDVIYNRKTKLLEFAKKVKARHCSGIGMLLNQGALAFELWTGKKAPVKVMEKALLKALNK
ncbi:MAG: shikimate dehydrogenase [Elusimicrobia bacterium]|nr:shikimate dehydrogenase [Candidatus Liberimonas magnetica]